jgi:hypothetical protein
MKKLSVFEWHGRVQGMARRRARRPKK